MGAPRELGGRGEERDRHRERRLCPAHYVCARRLTATQSSRRLWVWLSLPHILTNQITKHISLEGRKEEMDRSRSEGSKRGWDPNSHQILTQKEALHGPGLAQAGGTLLLLYLAPATGCPCTAFTLHSGEHSNMPDTVVSSSGGS